MGGEFQLHPRLAADCFEVGDLPLSRVLLLDDSRYPWLILVPRLAGLKEIHHLERDALITLMEESCRVAEFMERQFKPDKLNIAALGNLVPQLHLHHIARYQSDPAWPGPVWGHSSAVPYQDDQVEPLLSVLREGILS